MKKIIENLYVGSMEDYEALGPGVLSFSILGACKEPLHRRHAKIQGSAQEGYTGRSMPKDEPEYLFAHRSHALYLNLIDARTMEFIPKRVIFEGIQFIVKERREGRKVLIVCNKGESRSPALAFMYLMRCGLIDTNENCTFKEAENYFRTVYYPEYNPGDGIREFTKYYWEVVINGNEA